MGLLDRFGGEQGGVSEDVRHPGPLTWPGDANGFPIIGQAPGQLRQDEFEALDTKFTYHSKTFRMWVAQDQAEYLWVQSHIANGWFFEKHYERLWYDDRDEPAIWLEWVQTYAIAPHGTRDAVQIQIEHQPGVAFQVDSTSEAFRRLEGPS